MAAGSQAQAWAWGFRWAVSVREPQVRAAEPPRRAEPGGPVRVPGPKRAGLAEAQPLPGWVALPRVQALQRAARAQAARWVAPSRAVAKVPARCGAVPLGATVWGRAGAVGPAQERARAWAQVWGRVPVRLAKEPVVSPASRVWEGLPAAPGARPARIQREAPLGPRCVAWVAELRAAPAPSGAPLPLPGEAVWRAPRRVRGAARSARFRGAPGRPVPWSQRVRRASAPPGRWRPGQPVLPCEHRAKGVARAGPVLRAARPPGPGADRSWHLPGAPTVERAVPPCRRVLPLSTHRPAPVGREAARAMSRSTGRRCGRHPASRRPAPCRTPAPPARAAARPASRTGRAKAASGRGRASGWRGGRACSRQRGRAVGARAP